MPTAEYDLVICVGPHDEDIIQYTIDLIRRNLKGYINIYLIVSNPQLKVKDCIIIDENCYPFNIKSIQKYLPREHKTRAGWYFQQLLKLYACFVIKDLNERFVVIDADTLILKPMEFFDDKKTIFNIMPPNNPEYFEHMGRMHPSLKQQIPYSGVANYMAFRRKYIKNLFDLIESEHSGEKFYKVFMNCVSAEKAFAGASEYELYLTYMIIYHPTKLLLHEIKNDRIYSLNEHIDHSNTYVNLHWYSRR